MRLFLELRLLNHRNKTGSIRNHGPPFGLAAWEVYKATDTAETHLETTGAHRYSSAMRQRSGQISIAELQRLFRPFCEKHHIRRLEVFGSAARGQAATGSDVDLLVTLDDSRPVKTTDLLEMAGEAEELAGAPVDFVLRRSVERSPNPFAREHILASAITIYAS